MRCRLIGVLVGTLCGCGLSASAAAAYTPPPVLPWESLLPGLSTASNPQPGAVAGCAIPTSACIDYEISRMDALRNQFGCDHRALFATTYEVLTQVLRDALQADPGTFRAPNWVISEDATFANMYFGTIERYSRGLPVPEAWQIALDTARSGDANGLQDMLLGINAHVQRDMPYMLAAVGLHAADGTSHKADHDRFNELLNQAYERVVDTLAARYDAAVNLIAPNFNPLLGFAGNVNGDQLVQAWREAVWRNAEALLNARTPADRADVERLIELNAATTARMIAAPQLPQYRGQRDAYCAAHNTKSTPAQAAPRAALAPSGLRSHSRSACRRQRHSPARCSGQSVRRGRRCARRSPAARKHRRAIGALICRPPRARRDRSHSRRRARVQRL